MHLLKYKSFAASIFVFLSLANNSFAGGSNQCEMLFAISPLNLPIEDLKTESAARTAWIHDQSHKSNAFFKARQSRKWLESFFKKEYDVEKEISKFQSSDKTFELKLINRGLAKATELVLERTKSFGGVGSTILYSTHAVRRNNSIYSTEFTVSPDEKFVVVSEAQAGSLDKFTYRIFDLSSLQQVDTLTNADSSLPIWKSYRSFGFTQTRDSSQFWRSYKIGGNRIALDLKGTSGLLQSKTKKFFFAKGSEADSSKFYLSTLEKARWSEIDCEIEAFTETMIGNELIVKAKTPDGLGELRAITIIDGVPKKYSRLVLKQNAAIIRKLWSQKDRIIIYENDSKANYLNIFNSSGEILNQYVMPTCCSVTDIEYVDSSKLVVSLSSPIIESRKIAIDLNRNQYIEEDPNITMMTDENGTLFQSEIVESKSADGTMIPMRLVYKAGLKRDSNNPVVMLGYGGFASSPYFFPSYSPSLKLAIQNGAIYAAPALRGGNEFGEAWHNSGKMRKKQNTFNDFYSSAEFLIRNGYTNSSKIAAMGWSNGGLLMVAIVTQRPDLFGVVIVGNGVLDMLSKESLDFKFSKGWSYEYGNSQNSEMKPVISAYSPLENAKPALYPTVIVANGLNDSRVNSAHSYEFTAAMQKAQQGPNPVLLTSIKNSGHFLTTFNVQKTIAWRANVMIWSTIFDVLGISEPEKK